MPIAGRVTSITRHSHPVASRRAVSSRSASTRPRIQRVGSAGTTTSTGTAISVPFPTASVVAGNFAILTLITTSPNTANTPSGWSVQAAGGTFYKVLDGTEGSSVALTLTGSGAAIGLITVWNGVNQNTPFDVAATSNSGSSSPGTGPAITPVTAGTVLYTIARARISSGTLVIQCTELSTSNHAVFSPSSDGLMFIFCTIHPGPAVGVASNIKTPLHFPMFTTTGLSRSGTSILLRPAS